jgi:predicted nucleic acid-binding protein
VSALVVDTSCWITYFKGRKEFPDIDQALHEARVHLPPLVIAELLSARLSPKEQRELLGFLKLLPLCEPDFQHWVRVGELRSKLLRKGLTVSTPDAHIAQCTLDLNAILFSEDLIFRKINHHIDLRLG